MFEAASSILGKEVDATFTAVLVFSFLVLASITSLMLFFVVRFRKSRNRTPADIEGNALLETLWTVIPVFIVLVIFYYGWTGYKKRFSPPPDAMTVSVTARQWSWSFEYEDGARSDVLRVPLGRPVRLALASTDVIHSLYIPAFRVKEDVVPGKEESFLWFTPDAPGTYDIFCTEYCGLGHSMMLTEVEVMEEAAFREWLAGKAAEAAAPEGSIAERGMRLASEKGCTACHTADGTPLVGPSWKSIYMKEETVVTEGRERKVLVDDEYLRRSMLEPEADVVKGYPPVMPSQKGLMTDEEIEAVIEYMKTLK